MEYHFYSVNQETGEETFVKIVQAPLLEVAEALAQKEAARVRSVRRKKLRWLPSISVRDPEGKLLSTVECEP